MGRGRDSRRKKSHVRRIHQNRILRNDRRSCISNSTRPVRIAHFHRDCTNLAPSDSEKILPHRLAPCDRSIDSLDNSSHNNIRRCDRGLRTIIERIDGTIKRQYLLWAFPKQRNYEPETSGEEAKLLLLRPRILARRVQPNSRMYYTCLANSPNGRFRT